MVISDQQAKVFNQAARTVMEKHQVKINNLYDAVREKRNEYQKGPDDVHYNDAGRDVLAAKVADQIKRSLTTSGVKEPKLNGQ